MPEPSWLPEPESDRTIEENWLFRLRRERYRSRKSRLAHDFYVLHLVDAVSVVAMTEDRRLILVRQFRAGSAKDSLETPGGLLNPGEDALTAGARELLEETGYAGDPPTLLNTAWSNPSLMTSKIITIAISNARKIADLALDHGEEVEVELVDVDAIPAMIRDGRIDHALSVLGLFAWMLRSADGSSPR
jgi:8-oxo-dGTP pyrophosphatase MutT (NUDIX family)